MTPEAKCAAVLVAAPAALPFFHGALNRLLRVCGARAPRQAAAVLAVLLGCPLALAACWRWSWTLEPRDWLVGSAAYALVAYLAFGYAYFHLYNLTETGRRIRILDEFRRGGAMTVEELEARYAPSGMLKVRLDRLVDLGEATLDQGRYRVKGFILLCCARALNVYRRLLGFQ